ncbi:MAG: nucleotidyltransferase domain-containing protein [Elusimicrobiota bacterium]
MRLEHYPVKKLEKEVLQIVSRYLDTNFYKIFFFGSRVRGTNFPRADIDIGIEGPEEIPSAKKITIEDDLNNLPILYKIDFVDFKNVSEEFKQEALKYKEPIEL